MSDPLPRRLPLSPRVRKIMAFAALLIGVLIVGRVLVPVAPRDVSVHVRLAELRDPPTVARGLTVTFSRRGEAIRTVHARFDASGPPLEWHAPITLPQGAYRATVDVELDHAVLTRAQDVTVEPGVTLMLPAPAPALP